jgi:hypothetical protein
VRELPETDPLVAAALQGTVARYFAGAHVVGCRGARLASGLSGAEVTRYEVELQPPSGRQTIRLVTKRASLLERRTLAHLNAQRQPGVPFSYAPDMESDTSLVCMQDVGDVHRPYSRDPITPEELAAEADSLASIHAANLSRAGELPWLPRLDARWAEELVVERVWQPRWRIGLDQPGLGDLLQPYREPVERRAAGLRGELQALLDLSGLQTLIHTDVNPSNVRVLGSRVYFIDWQTPHYGPLFLDLPHHFCTPEQAEYYRLALSDRGVPLSASRFAGCYRRAARIIGLRYLWWTLEAWDGSAGSTDWVRHYLGLILS